ncbi:hypothetical protein RRG08_039982 [Elysia crispata]|uniref:Uncharacterized protein n=1 Tax=Elysia crispata TaxID=231223 RepID=A0AAE1DBH0_9GAST|nr:hypothetical protein RRG08_039982 [Elysia crispata]
MRQLSAVECGGVVLWGAAVECGGMRRCCTMVCSSGLRWNAVAMVCGSGVRWNVEECAVLYYEVRQRSAVECGGVVLWGAAVECGGMRRWSAALGCCGVR